MTESSTNQFFLAIAVTLALAGCATTDVNSAHPRTNTGYVDFYTDSSGELAWRVERFDDETQNFKQVYSKFNPQPGRVLRLGLPPGRHQLRLTSLNRFTREPGLVELEVKDGMITPVHVVLTPEGTGLVDRKEQRLGATAYGRYGRSTKITTEETVVFQVSIEENSPISYLPKEKTDYAR